jgi:hypothetical protein
MASGLKSLPRLALAALVSGAAAGLLATLALYVGALLLLGGWAWEGLTAASLFAGLAAGAAAGLFVATVPAFLAGATMWALGRRFEAARRLSAWSAAGAVGGVLFWAVAAAAVRIRVGEPGLTGLDATLLAAGFVGAGSALAFRAVAAPGWSEARRAPCEINTL